MASIKNFKKNVTSVLGELIDTIFIWELVSEKESPEAKELIEDIYSVYEGFLRKINNPEGAKGAYYKSLHKDFEKEVHNIVQKINTLK